MRLRSFTLHVLCAFGLLVSGLAPPAAAAGGPGGTYHITLAPAGQPPVALYVEERGSGPPIVLLHGLGSSGYSWHRQVPELARSHRVITIDLRGFGRSDKPFDAHYSAADQAALVGAFLAARNLSSVTLVGHSFGGVVSLLVALDPAASRRVSRLVLVSTPALPQPFSAGVAFLRQPVLPYVALMLVPAELPTAFGLYSENADMSHLGEADLRIYADPIRGSAGRHALIESARQLRPANAAQVIARYRSVRQPTLIVSCRNDRIVPLSTGQRLVRMLPRARLEVIDGCDHIPSEQRPAAVTALIRGFR